MKKILCVLLFLPLAFFASAQSDILSSYDPHEVRYIKGQKSYDLDYQNALRSQPDWQEFLEQHGTWYVHFNEENQNPHRAFGEPIAVPVSDPEQQALFFIQNYLTDFNIPSEDLLVYGKSTSGKNTFVNFRQYYAGFEVLNSRMIVKLFEDKVIMFGADVFDNIELNTMPTLNPEQAIQYAQTNIENISSIEFNESLKVLAIPTFRSNDFRLIYEVVVKTVDPYGVPANYQTYVDAHTGEILARTNLVKHLSNCDKCKKPSNPVLPMGFPPLTVSADVTGEVYPTNPYNASEILPLPNLKVIVSGNDYYTDETGQMTAPVTGPINGGFRLEGLWCTVYTDNVTPGFSQLLQEGSNDAQFTDVNSNIKERSAYYHVNVIHDHHQAFMPGYTGMDFSLATNVDVAGTCNAFYDGSSINFYALGGGCNGLSQVADVVYHEYGHGINDNYYQSEGSSFNNGAMGEGYADFWGISVTNNPILGQGFYTDSQDGIRRYDEDPKVYPIDLVGEVHSDGEIIMGAWYDTHLLLGGDWDVTIPLFVEAYAGLQAEAANGNEGEAFLDVLIDVLQADDDDGDITNGTPNGDAIVEGFDIHGITLLSNAAFYHNDLEFAVANEDVTINATLDLQFPFTQFLSDVKLFYRINDSQTWIESELTSGGGDNYSGTIPAQPKGTVVGYYLGLLDINGAVSQVQPTGAHAEIFPRLPYFILVGVEPVASHDCDDNEDWGPWTEGIASDNATTGMWIFDEPIGSYSDLGVMVQVEYQHTAGGEYCFLTGNAAEGEGLGTNDVDTGKTTLETTEMDLSEYTNPIVTYWRYYTNSPPSGANPGADYWQVLMSDNGGATWQYIENTLTTDNAWRRNAIRLLDYTDQTDEIMFQFVASDSTHIGQELDGGSLIEAALDDFVVYDEITVGVEEKEGLIGLSVFPNPADQFAFIDFSIASASVVNLALYNSLGEQIWNESALKLNTGNHRRKISVAAFAEGVYLLTLDTENGSVSKKISVRK